MLRDVLVYKIANHLLRNLSNFSISLLTIVYWNRKKILLWMKKKPITKKKFFGCWQFLYGNIKLMADIRILSVWNISGVHIRIFFMYEPMILFWGFRLVNLFLWIVLKHMLPWGGKWVVQWFNTRILFGRISLQKT